MLPSKMDLRPNMPPIYAQGGLGSCTAQAIVAAVVYLLKKQKSSLIQPSRLFLYYNERVILGTVDEDSGAMIRDGMKSLAKDGVCQELMWPYTIQNFTKKPSDACYREASRHQALKYFRIPTSNLAQCKMCLAMGFPFVFGMAVYESFETSEATRTGEVPMPLPTETMLGGHAVLAVGYDDIRKVVICRNSWGSSWGMHGYFTLPYAFLQNSDFTDDYWTLRLMEA
jgi:C1A family cysteine protease